MVKEYICIMCPKGCDIEVWCSAEGIEKIEGNECPRGKDYVRGEIEHPVRNLATSVLVEGGEEPLTSVRLSHPIPKEALFKVRDEIQKITLSAPVTVGQVVIANIQGLGSDVIVTRKINLQKSNIHRPSV